MGAAITTYLFGRRAHFNGAGRFAPSIAVKFEQATVRDQCGGPVS